MLRRKQDLPDELPGWLGRYRQVLIFEVAVHVCDPGRNGFKIPIDSGVLPTRGVVLLVFRQLLNEGYEIGLSRNLLDKNYFEFLTAQPGNSGLYVGLPGDPRTIGLTLRMNLR